MTKKPLLVTSAVALVLLITFLAVPAALADDPSTPVQPPPSPSSIEGVVTSVVAPANPTTSGPIVAVLDGLISFDASGATVRLPDGSQGTIDDVKPGVRVAALLAPFDGTALPHAQTIMVMGDTNAARIGGILQAVDTDGKTITLLGLTIHVTDQTAIGGPGDGATAKTLSDLNVGDPVLVDAVGRNGTLTALKIMKLAPAPMPVQRIHGLVKSIGTESWVVTPVPPTASPAGAPVSVPADVTVKITPETKISGDPKVGDTVDVLAQSDSAGNLVALAIAKFTPPPPPPVTIHGKVKSISADAWVITPTLLTPVPNSADTTTSDVTVKVTADTQISGNPAVGDEVNVVAQQASGGQLVALSIVKVTSPPPPPVQIHGWVKSISPDTWVISTGPPGSLAPAGSTAPDFLLKVTASTRIEGNPGVGDEVNVVAQQASATGQLVALSIVKVTPPPPPVFLIHGKVVSITGDIWAIQPTSDGPVTQALVSVRVTSTTKITGNPRVGDQVDVVAQGSSSGIPVALEITKTTPPPPPPVLSFHGRVKTISADAWVITPMATVSTTAASALTADIRVRITNATKITGNPQVGDQVDVQAQNDATGVLVALSITKTASTPAPSPTPGVKFDGTVRSVQGTTWMVDTVQVMVSPATVITGSPKVGDRVHVEGNRSSTGAVMALSISKL